jgi:DMSO/TMAO reductase YedYZ heme-binding membrane subunit
MLRALLKNLRFYVLVISFSLALTIYFWVKSNVPSETVQSIRLTQIYGFTSFAYLYIALLATPLTRTFTFLPFRPQYLHARRAIGVSAFFFGLLHAYNAFFNELGGFSGLGFLDTGWLVAITLSFIALVILTVMASTSFNFMVRKLGNKTWKNIHRFVYLASLLILIHAVLIGTHFAYISDLIPKIILIAVGFLLILEAIRFDKFIKEKLPQVPSLGLTVVACAFVIILLAQYVFSAEVIPSPLGTHAEHLALANRSQGQQQQQGANRYNVNFEATQNPRPNQNISLSFKIFDASSGLPVDRFQMLYEKNLHLIIVDSELGYYDHIHPEQKGSEFTIQTNFPKEGRYHLYIDFQPLGDVEQQFAFTLNVGNPENIIPSNHSPDQNLTKTFGNYKVTFSMDGQLEAQKLSRGSQKVIFTVNDSSGNSVTDLKPYLAAFGHMVMIKKDTYDYIHVHPSAATPPGPDENGGPNVEFYPIGLFGPIEPGTYRIFTQFNPKGKLLLTDFTVEVK